MREPDLNPELELRAQGGDGEEFPSEAPRDPMQSGEEQEPEEEYDPLAEGEND